MRRYIITNHSSLIFHFTIFWPCSAAQTCTTTTEEITKRNIEAGDCKTNKTNKQSTANVTIHAIDDPNTKVNERTNCNFQCQEGYFDKDIGYTILFKCDPNADRTSPTGTRTPPTNCAGAWFVSWPFPSLWLHSGPDGCVGILWSITPHSFFHITIF